MTDLRELAPVCQLIDQFDPTGDYPTVDRDLQLKREAIEFAEAEFDAYVAWIESR